MPTHNDTEKHTCVVEKPRKKSKQKKRDAYDCGMVLMQTDLICSKKQIPQEQVQQMGNIVSLDRDVGWDDV